MLVGTIITIGPGIIIIMRGLGITTITTIIGPGIIITRERCRSVENLVTDCGEKSL